MPKDNVVVGVDVGTTKVATVISTASPDGSINVLGVSSVPSRGLRKGQIVNIEEAVRAISESLEAAERMAGYSVGSTFVSVGGTHISSENSKGVVAVSEPDKEITPSDVERVLGAARAVNIPSSREIIHVLPRGFIVDGQEGIADPVGMTGVRLEAEAHIVSGSSTALRNLVKCFDQVGVDVESPVFSGLASSESVLTDTEKELGVVLVDIGGGTTSINIYVEGACSYSSVLPIGAKNITNDLAIGLRISLESAEQIKLFLSQKTKLPTLPSKDEEKKEGKEKEEDELNLSSLGLSEDLRKVSRKTLVEGIIRPRLNEIFTMVGLEIKKSGFGGLTPSGVVLTGGGAQTLNAVETCKRILAMPTRIGLPRNLTGLIDEIQTPAFACVTGLLFYGRKYETGGQGVGFPSLSSFSRLPIKGLLGKLIDFIRSFLP